MTTIIEDRETSTATSAPWKDVYMRKALDDQGAVPYKGSWLASPDIVPAGPEVIPHHEKVLTDTFDKDIGKPTRFDVPNYFYVRGKNLFTGPRTASIELYYCPMQLFLFPSLWKRGQLKTSSGKLQVAASANAVNGIVVGAEPFTLVPEASPRHHCLISRVMTPGNPNPLPTDEQVGTPELLGKYICDHPDYAWRNVVTVDGAAPLFTEDFSIEIPGTQGVHEVLLGLSFKNLNAGSRLSFSAGTPIPSGPDQGKTLSLVETAVSQSDGSVGTAILWIPSGYKTNVKYSYWPKERVPTKKGWRVEFYAIAVVATSSELYSQAVPLREFDELGGNVSPELLIDEDGNPRRGIKAGSCAMVGAT